MPNGPMDSKDLSMVSCKNLGKSILCEFSRSRSVLDYSMKVGEASWQLINIKARTLHRR